ncbi:aldehyde dehydrogenase domain-containing protein [Pelagophyceae sp. CCMP2097]|nr:aldehyde dehydrogenase domain-containing protein [Pelagophyceae sp. CCMP2097]|mmetsp:Transcript_20188/g.71808  ORF Transcript_20188/g.71808 Transcript_20188/m.71808 type:complete len:522 (+) Transcript_20188:42-1607(+)
MAPLRGTVSRVLRLSRRWNFTKPVVKPPPMVHKRYGLWIDNGFIAGNGGKIDIENPYTEEKVTTVDAASEADVAAAVASSKLAFPAWRDAGAKHRAAVLRRAAVGLRAALPALAPIETLCTGRPIAEFRAQLARLPEWFEYHAAVAETREDAIPPFGGDASHIAMVARRPLGVCGVVTPWNHPLLIATKKVAVALATGNTVVIKPPEIAPISVLALAAILKEAGAPPGVVNVVPGHGHVAAAALAAHRDVARIDFTGGDVAGSKIGALVGGRAASFCAELGGNAPVLVFDDVDLEEAVNGVAFGAFVAAGQTCVSAKRIFVAQSIFVDFVEKLARKAAGLKLGDPAEATTQIGPLSSKRALDNVVAQLALIKGKKFVCGTGKRADGYEKGHFLEPVVMTNVTLHDEIFGPVVSVAPFQTEAEAISLANASRHHLGAAVWTQDVRRAHRVMRKLEAGVIWCNAHHRNSPDAPWGGFGASGVGRENGLESHKEYTAPYTMIIRTDDAKEDWFARAPQEPQRYG